MIRINKPASKTPPVLSGKGKDETKKLGKLTKAQLSAHKFDSKLYGGAPVKNVLKRLQGDKCCFCEAKVSHVSHGDVEHFRPKGGWTQGEGGPLVKPGYWWLAYDFTNLFLSCQLCNQTFKKNYFPLASGGKRASGPKSSLAAEKALIIDPSREDPAKFLTFHEEMAVARNGHAKGAETIKRTGLNRPKIVEERLFHLETLKLLADVARGTTTQAAKARAHLKKMGKATSIYSLMVRENFPTFV